MQGTYLDARLDMLTRSEQFAPGVLDTFRDHLLTAPEDALFRMSPYRYAAEKGLSPRTAIDLFLWATHAGLLDFTWGVLCWACGAFLTTAPALRSLSGGYCTLCEVDAPLVEDDVEVAFTVNPGVRMIRFHQPERLDLRRDWKTLFFSPSRTLPQGFLDKFDSVIREVSEVPAGNGHALELDLPPGRYALFVPALHAWSHLVLEEGLEKRELELDLLPGHFLPVRARLGAGKVTLRINNKTPSGAMLGLMVDFIPTPEELPRAKRYMEVSPYLTGKGLVTSQVFRELFRAESIPSDRGLEFRGMTVVFTDLTGSTALYERVGDLHAYRLVRDHFKVLGRIVASRGGAVVKTIGDAVMATFAEVAAAVGAAADMTREIRKLEGDLQLKIGLHTGPCIAVELNERLDYFGQTVNISARVQALARSNEIVCTEEVFQAPGVAEVVRTGGLTVCEDRARLKGVDGPLVLHRLS